MSMNQPIPAAPRLASVDAYRGLEMCLMIGEALNLPQVAAKLRDSSFWALLADHQEHVEWIGCSLHDLIQPSFSFLVGVALPFSIAALLDVSPQALRENLIAPRAAPTRS